MRAVGGGQFHVVVRTCEDPFLFEGHYIYVIILKKQVELHLRAVTKGIIEGVGRRRSLTSYDPQ